MKPTLVLIGCGGHFKSVFDCIERQHYSEIIVLDDHAIGLPFECQGVRFGGKSEQLVTLAAQGNAIAHICIGNINLRRKLRERCIELGLLLETIIDSTAVVSSSAHIGDGTFIGKRAVVNVDSTIGANVIVNTSAIIEHDCVVGVDCHIAPGTVLTGGARIGDGVFMGAGSVVLPYKQVGNYTTIGANSTVNRDIPEGVTAFGSPCKVL